MLRLPQSDPRQGISMLWIRIECVIACLERKKRIIKLHKSDRLSRAFPAELAWRTQCFAAYRARGNPSTMVPSSGPSQLNWRRYTRHVRDIRECESFSSIVKCFRDPCLIMSESRYSFTEKCASLMVPVFRVSVNNASLVIPDLPLPQQGRNTYSGPLGVLYIDVQVHISASLV